MYQLDNYEKLTNASNFLLNQLPIKPRRFLVSRVDLKISWVISILKFNQTYPLNYVDIKSLSVESNSTPLIIPQTKFEVIISKDMGEIRFKYRHLCHDRFGLRLL